MRKRPRSTERCCGRGGGSVPSGRGGGGAFDVLRRTPTRTYRVLPCRSILHQLSTISLSLLACLHLVHLYGEVAPESRKVDVRLPGKVNSNSHGARPVHLIITMIKWIRTGRLSIKTSLSLCPSSCSGNSRQLPGTYRSLEFGSQLL